MPKSACLSSHLTIDQRIFSLTNGPPLARVWQGWQGCGQLQRAVHFQEVE